MAVVWRGLHRFSRARPFHLCEDSLAEGVLAQAFAAGAIITMLADTMLPEAYWHGGKEVRLLTVLGFGRCATGRARM